MDWRKSLSKSLEKNFNFVISCDCADHSSVDPLAHLVDFSLNPDEGTFLHVGPAGESVYDLQRKLGSTHNIKAKSAEIVLEKIDLVPIVLESLEDVEAQMNNEIEAGSYVEFKSTLSSRHAALIAGSYDDPDYEAGMRAAQEREEVKRLAIVQKAEEEARIKAELEAKMQESYVSPVSSNLAGSSYLEQLSGGFSAGKSAPAPNSDAIIGGPESYLDQLSSGISFMQSQSYIAVSVPQAERAIAVSSVAPVTDTSQSTAQNLKIKRSLTETELRAIESMVESKVEKLVEAVVEASVEAAVEACCEETALIASNVSVAVQPTRVTTTTPSPTRTMTTTTTTSSKSCSRYFGTGAPSNTFQKTSSNTFTSQPNASLVQSISPQGSLAEAELHELEKSMEAEVESFAERSVEVECEKSAESIVEGMHYPCM